MDNSCVVYHSVRASVYETHQNTLGSTDDSIAVVCPVATEMKWHSIHGLPKMLLPCQQKMLMDPHRLQKLIRKTLDFLKRRALPLMSLMFALDEEFR